MYVFVFDAKYIFEYCKYLHDYKDSNCMIFKLKLTAWHKRVSGDGQRGKLEYEQTFWIRKNVRKGNDKQSNNCTEIRNTTNKS